MFHKKTTLLLPQPWRPPVKEYIEKATKSDCMDIAKLAILMWENYTVEELIEEFEAVIQDKESASDCELKNEISIEFHIKMRFEEAK